MSTIPSVDTAMDEVREVGLEADLANDKPVVAATLLILDKLLDKRLHLPQQRPPS